MFKEAYKENHTPSYVFDLDSLRARVEAVKKGITRKGARLCLSWRQILSWWRR